MSDPFDGITPIGARREPPQLAAVSQRERRVRASADHSALPKPAALRTTAADGQPKDAAKKPRWKLSPKLTIDEMRAMAERIAKKAYADAMTLDKPADRKHAATAFGIAVDKHTMLSGRPTQIHEVRGDERAGMRDLARRLLA